MQNNNGSETGVFLSGFDISGLPRPECRDCFIVRRMALTLNEVFPSGENISVRRGGENTWRVAVGGSQTVESVIQRKPTPEEKTPAPILAIVDSPDCCGHRTIRTNCNEFCNEKGQFKPLTSAFMEEVRNPLSGEVSSASFQIKGI
ncbi:MAG: hypothetical protein WCT01_01300 [Candidatus Shapirobacteria bacterium]